MKVDLILLAQRLAFGGIMLFSHGIPKLLSYSEKAATFADPLGVGPEASMALAIFAEVFCSAAVMLGVMTRFAAIPLVITMSTAAILVHADDPWNIKEHAVLFLIPFACLIVTGGGRFALDSFRRRPSV